MPPPNAATRSGAAASPDRPQTEAGCRLLGGDAERGLAVVDPGRRERHLADTGLAPVAHPRREDLAEPAELRARELHLVLLRIDVRALALQAVVDQWCAGRGARVAEHRVEVTARPGLGVDLRSADQLAGRVRAVVHGLLRAVADGEPVVEERDRVGRIERGCR